jgi:hypothetical protein
VPRRWPDAVGDTTAAATAPPVVAADTASHTDSSASNSRTHPADSGTPPHEPCRSARRTALPTLDLRISRGVTRASVAARADETAAVSSPSFCCHHATPTPHYTTTHHTTPHHTTPQPLRTLWTPSILPSASVSTTGTNRCRTHRAAAANGRRNGPDAGVRRRGRRGQSLAPILQVQTSHRTARARSCRSGWARRRTLLADCTDVPWKVDVKRARGKEELVCIPRFKELASRPVRSKSAVKRGQASRRDADDSSDDDESEAGFPASVRTLNKDAALLRGEFAGASSGVSTCRRRAFVGAVAGSASRSLCSLSNDVLWLFARPGRCSVSATRDSRLPSALVFHMLDSVYSTMIAAAVVGVVA